MKRLRKLLSLPISDQALLVNAVLLTGIMRAALKVLPFRQVMQYVRQAAQQLKSRTRADASYRRRVTWAVSAVGHRLMPDRPCLTQALVAQFLLLRRQCPTHLRIGVAKDEDGTLTAHAWLEYEGQVIVGGSDAVQTYVPFKNVEAGL